MICPKSQKKLYKHEFSTGVHIFCFVLCYTEQKLRVRVGVLVHRYNIDEISITALINIFIYKENVWNVEKVHLRNMKTFVIKLI